RIVKGKGYFNGMSETLMKFKPGRAKFIASERSPVALSEDARPKRAPDVSKGGMGATWVENAEWMYGGVGYGGAGGTCVCWHARMCLDYLGRSFAPELERSHIAVLDSAGNLILRIGKYGNVDDGRPLVADGSPASPKALGGDEVSLSYAAYLGTHTDRRLFIHDAGNGRIVSVKLGYHTDAKVALKDVPEQQQ
ncbi:MAG: hypothetical protein KDA41_14385, partial [Planctomycetales bacterium]|nr:hypothetical protein [Planctomycetales bacterium]